MSIFFSRSGIIGGLEAVSTRGRFCLTKSQSLVFKSSGGGGFPPGMGILAEELLDFLLWYNYPIYWILSWFLGQLDIMC